MFSMSPVCAVCVTPSFLPLSCTCTLNVSLIPVSAFKINSCCTPAPVEFVVTTPLVEVIVTDSGNCKTSTVQFRLFSDNADQLSVLMSAERPTIETESINDAPSQPLS